MQSPENDGVGLYMELGATLWHTRKARNQRIFRERAEFQSSPICNIRSGMAADINSQITKVFYLVNSKTFPFMIALDSALVLELVDREEDWSKLSENKTAAAVALVTESSN
ncbi:hypothetical protein D5086_026073 [Populus alba]|uniref:Uncharacterized protein n=1 Tax=Populus alba TaxID=43335 RepID=A0ACC4B1Q6_POPAL